MSSSKMTGGEAVVATLEAHGIEVVFGIPGGHSLGVYDALARSRSIRHVLGRHEQGLGFMADGYARASGKIGVLSTTSGPAVGNLACSLGGSTTDTSPVLAIASTVRSDLVGRNRGGLHDCGESLEIMRPVCRQVRRCNSVEEIPSVIAELIHKLKTGRPGAAYCEIPVDLIGAEAEIAIPGPLPVDRAQPDPEKITKAARLLSAARKRVIWAGTGATLSEAGPELEALAERLGAVVVTTVLGRGILPADHPRVVAKEGAYRTPMIDFLAEADVVLAVGTMFKQEDTVNWSAKLGSTLIHIDIDPAEMGRSYEPDLGIVADAKAALAAILHSLPDSLPADPAWVARAKEVESESFNKRQAQSPASMRAMQILRAAVPRDGVIVADRCNLGYWAFCSMPVYEPRTFQYPLGYGGLGGSLPQAIGAKIACPEKTVVSVIGDGGFQFTATELAVAVQENIPITIILCNNGIYGAIRANQVRNFEGRCFGCDLVNPDFATLAKAYGIPLARAETLEAFEQALDGGIRSGKLNIVELTIDIPDPAPL